MTRFRITIRGDAPRVELRGFADFNNLDGLSTFAATLKPYGVVLASVAEDDHQFTEAWPW